MSLMNDKGEIREDIQLPSDSDLAEKISTAVDSGEDYNVTILSAIGKVGAPPHPPALPFSAPQLGRASSPVYRLGNHVGRALAPGPLSCRHPPTGWQHGPAPHTDPRSPDRRSRPSTSRSSPRKRHATPRSAVCQPQ